VKVSDTPRRRRAPYAPLAPLLVALVAGTSGTLPPAAQAQSATCYVDDRGRVVTRRRPGFRAIDCPTNDAPSAAGDRAIEPSTDELPADEPPAGERPAEDRPAITPQPSATPAPRDDVEAPAAPAPRATPAPAPQSSQAPRDGLYRLPGRRLSREERAASDAPGGRAPNTPSPIPRVTLADHRPDEPMPDRWRVVDSIGYTTSLLDPYNRNPLKADRPVFGEWFYNVALAADTIIETRDLPTPVGSSSTLNPGDTDVFGDGAQSLTAQNVALELVYYKGDTVFRPPDHEFRLAAAFNVNDTRVEELQAINADPADGDTRLDNHVGLQAAFYDKHLRNINDRYDFDSFRIGIQPFSSDFRGFLFQDNQFGARLFGTRNNNLWQYNLAWFRRIEKDTNSGLNDVSQPLRNDDVFVANLYRQDWPVLGFISQATMLYNVNSENSETHYDQNDFIQRPASIGREAFRDYSVLYLGYNGDGHFGRWNVTTSFYQALGTESRGTFVDREQSISASFAAIELSRDFDWIRPRVSFLYASGDSDPFDDVATGFDAVFENPIFAGGETSYWNRQSVPLVAGGRVGLSSRNGLLNSLRASKEEGQSNFTNPGLVLAGIGVDMDLKPTLRLSLNLNTLAFDTTAVLETARNQPDIDEAIGQDVSAAVIWRPFMSQNLILRGSYATLLPGPGFDDLFPDETAGYFLFNATLNY